MATIDVNMKDAPPAGTLPVAAPTAALVHPKPAVSVPTLMLAMAFAFLLAWNLHGLISITTGPHSITIDWSGQRPTPVPPVPIPPDPVPIPPGPAPVPPAPGPTPTDKLRVLFLYDSNNTRTREQNVALSSTAIRSYLTSRCMTEADGRPAWRFWDKTTPVSEESPAWQAAMKAGLSDPTPTPKMVVFAAEKPTVYPITNEADTLATLRKWGGN